MSEHRADRLLDYIVLSTPSQIRSEQKIFWDDLRLG